MDQWLPSWAEASSAIQWAEEVEKIKLYASSIIVQLREEFQVGGKHDSVGLKFEDPKSDRSIASIRSPIANGRIRLEFVVDSTVVSGRLVVERESYTLSDERTWLEVWALRCNGDERLWINLPGDAEEIDLRGYNSQDWALKRYKLGLFIYYALAHKP
ncbi:hypothetical protein KIV45_15800 [Janthinobacterium lividum]|nr:hypothetical protein KIV45_15800 [Janthinobacterium lividum]